MKIGNLKAVNDKYQMFSVCSDETETDAKFIFSAKDNLTSKDFETKAGSRILEGYHPPFDAIPIAKMREAGGFLSGKTNMDEFGFGTFSANSAFGIPKNPFDLNRSMFHWEYPREDPSSVLHRSAVFTDWPPHTAVSQDTD